MLQLCDERALIVLHHFDLLDDCQVQRIAVGIPLVTQLVLAAVFYFANVGVNAFSVCRFALAQLRVHSAAAAAEQKSRQQRFIAARFAVGFRLIAVQGFLYPYPLPAGNNTGMLPHRYDPFFRRQIPCGTSFLLIGSIVDHQSMYTVKGRFVREEVCILIYKVVVHFIVGYNIHRVLQNRLDGEARVVFAVFRLDAALHQLRFRVRQ